MKPLGFNRFTEIDRKDESTWPPYMENIMLVVQGTRYKAWCMFPNAPTRNHFIITTDYTHWREEMTCDSP